MQKSNEEQVQYNKLLVTFPTEIWLSILMRLDNYRDYVQVSSSSKLFKSLLQSFRTILLFRNIFKTLFEHKYEPERQTEFRALLSFRAVCSPWRNGVDSVVHNLNYPFYSKFCPWFASLEDFQEFWSFFSDENGDINPFTLRSVQLYLPSSLLELPPYYAQLLKMLRRFGQKIWYCKINMHIEDPMEHTDFFEQFVYILQQLPKLRKLLFENSTYYTRYPVQLPSEALLLQEYPTLKHLFYVKTLGMPTSVARKILKSNPQIREVCGEHWLIHLETPNLDSVCVNICHTNRWETFQNARVASPLKYLKLNFYLDEVSWNSLLSTINCHVGNTLEELNIVALYHSNIPKRRTDSDEDYSSPGILRRLKVMKLYTKHVIALDFLLPIRETLERLEIVISDRNANDDFVKQSEVIVKFHKFGKRFNKSNIWQLFGNLKCISVERQPNHKIVYNRP